MSGNATKKKVYGIFKIAFLVYVISVIYFLFFSDRYGRTVPYDTMQYNLVPFEEIRRYILNWRCFTFEQVVLNMAGNVCLFVPYGALLFIWKGKPTSFLEVTLSSALLSVVIEIIQLITRVGVCDVDDIILNTVGGMIGYFIYLTVRTVFRRIKRNAKRKKKL